MPKQEEKNGKAAKFLKEKVLKINRTFPKDLETTFVNHFVAQHQEDYFIITAYQVWMPIIIGTDEDRIAELDAIDSVDAKCVARWVLTPSDMIDLVDILQRNLAKFQKKLEDIEDSYPETESEEKE